MTCCVEGTELEIVKGASFSRVVRWSYADRYIYRPITGIAKTAPARVTSPAHGVPDGWPVAIASVTGMRQINARGTPPRASDFHPATVIDVNTIDINAINAAGFSTYVSGGYVQYFEPVDLTGFSAVMTVRETEANTSTVLLTATSVGGEIVLDNATKTIVILLSAAVVSALTWDSGFYDLALTSGTGVVTLLAEAQPVTVRA